MNRKKAPNWDKIEKRDAPRKEKPMPRLLDCTVLSDVTPEFVRWLWYPYIPAGKLTIIEGDPGLGKSWISCAIATAVAGGLKLPGMNNALPPQKILLASAEDDTADTLVPRLLGMGADMTRIVHVDNVFILDKTGIRALEATMLEYAAAVVFIDPLVAYLGARMDMNKANEVREVMEGLKVVAERTGAAIIAIRHLRKAGGKNIYAGLGSIDFTAAARSVLSVCESKEGEKIIRHIKHNCSAEGRTLTYSLGEPVEDPDNPGQFGPGTFEWTGWYTGPLVEEAGERKVSTTPRKKDLCSLFMFDMLKDGPVLAKEALKNCIQAGYKSDTIKKAKKGLVSSRKNGRQNWEWFLIDKEGMD